MLFKQPLRNRDLTDSLMIDFLNDLYIPGNMQEAWYHNLPEYMHVSDLEGLSQRILEADMGFEFPDTFSMNLKDLLSNARAKMISLGPRRLLSNEILTRFPDLDFDSEQQILSWWNIYLPDFADRISSRNAPHFDDSTVTDMYQGFFDGWVYLESLNNIMKVSSALRDPVIGYGIIVRKDFDRMGLELLRHAQNQMTTHYSRMILAQDRFTNVFLQYYSELMGKSPDLLKDYVPEILDRYNNLRPEEEIMVESKGSLERARNLLSQVFRLVLLNDLALPQNTDYKDIKGAASQIIRKVYDTFGTSNRVGYANI